MSENSPHPNSLNRIPLGGEIFRTCPDRPWGPLNLLYNGYRVFPGVKSGRGVTLTPHPLLVPLVVKDLSYTSSPPMGRTACTEPQCLYKGGGGDTTTSLKSGMDIYIYIYMYIYNKFTCFYTSFSSSLMPIFRSLLDVTNNVYEIMLYSLIT
jgi:hypothetical protein